MLKKLCVSFFTIALNISLLGYSQQQPVNDNNSLLKKIDQQISNLEASLRKEEIEENNENIKSNQSMIADWKKYGEELKVIKMKEEQEELIRKQIKELKKQRAKLVNSSSEQNKK
ncbi:MAG: hypothetical protein H0W88_02145 [Parachlamydiaceae bacterium]|nr:hypothetical protein [Parachlamydiaceae bacterium]